jgi:hypothetical protein
MHLLLNSGELVATGGFRVNMAQARAEATNPLTMVKELITMTYDWPRSVAN